MVRNVAGEQDNHIKEHPYSVKFFISWENEI
jgi:hypothetical protein